MIKNIQYLVNAQVEINRAVFEANKPHEPGEEEPRPDYINTCVLNALVDLKAFKSNK